MNQKPLFLAVVLTALVVIGGAFCFMSRRLASVNQPVVTDPIVETQAQTELEKYPQYIEAIPGNVDEVWYNIPEYGVRMRLNKEFAEDLLYSFVRDKNSSGEEWDSIYFSGKKLLSVAPSCKNSLGTLGRSKGNLREMKKMKSSLDAYTASRLDAYVQAGDYFYDWMGPQKFVGVRVSSLM